MKPHIVYLALLACACAKTQSDVPATDTARISSGETPQANVPDTPVAQTPVESFALLSPAAGDTLVEGRTYIIRWRPGPVRHINLGAAMGGHDKGLILDNAPAKPDSLAWKVPVGFVTGFGPPSSDQIRLRLENADSTEQWVESAPFVVTGHIRR